MLTLTEVTAYSKLLVTHSICVAGHKKLAERKARNTELCLQPKCVPETVTGPLNLDFMPEYAPLTGCVKQAHEAGAAVPALGTVIVEERLESLHIQETC